MGILIGFHVPDRTPFPLPALRITEEPREGIETRPEAPAPLEGDSGTAPDAVAGAQGCTYKCTCRDAERG